MAAAITDLMDRVTDSTTGRPVIGALASPGKAVGAPSVTLADATNWTTNTAIHFSIYQTMVVGGATVKDPTTQTDWKGVLSGTTITGLTLTGGTDRAYVAGDIIELTPTARYAKDLYDLLSTLFNQDASLKAGPIQTALNLGSGSLNGWNALGYAPSTVTALGNRSYQMVFSGVDLTSTVSKKMRLRCARTVAAPTMCTSLNGSTQYLSKSSPAGMTFTNNFVVGAWIKMTAYGLQAIASRWNGINGWQFFAAADGTVGLQGTNAASGNYSKVTSSQSIPLNKWVHVAAQLDMSSFTATPTTSYIMIDGVDVPATVSRAGTNPTALIQAGNLEIGSWNGGLVPFGGKIAQVAIFNSKVTEAIIQSYYSQGLAGTETSLISAYSLSNSVTDLNTTNANNLTANGSATTTTVDAPWTQDDTGTPGGTNDFAIIVDKSFSTNTTLTVQVPEGCMLPTSGGIASVVYSTQSAPFGFPSDPNKWTILVVNNSACSKTAATTNTWYGDSGLTPAGPNLPIPIGAWRVSWFSILDCNHTTSGVVSCVGTLSTTSNSETDQDFTAYFRTYAGTSAQMRGLGMREKVLNLTTPTTYYLNLMTADPSNSISTRGSQTPTTIKAVCAYL